ncbi:MAG: di-trans,poly-cis-decaprenylcistransferase [Holosporaceae bacterium]|jgi:undecaprenyl diphosphate synthase|nr:di-trans,poly-cis-decaprenylcistransferase [Holosporaceae bacterium]
MDHSIRHIAFVPDGNRRWAGRRGLSPLLGHKSGYELIKSLTPLLKNYGIRYVTYYMFSIENWSRSEEEVTYLMGIFRNFFSDIKGYVQEHDIRLVIIGDLARLPADVTEKIALLEDSAKNNRSLTMVAAVSYGGRDEIVRAAGKVASDFADGKITLDELDENKFASYMDAPDLPYPDALVRTGEKRISNFLIWQTAYSEVFFVDKLWPDFNEEDLRAVIFEFSRRERRYGR